MNGRHGALAVILGLALLAGACQTISDEYIIEDEPYELVAVAGSDLARVVLTEDAVRRLDIQTESVDSGPDGGVVSSAAIIIDPQGRYWVYTNPAPREYVRAELGSVVERDQRAYFVQGPAEGTTVVTVGVPELYGTELGVGK